MSESLDTCTASVESMVSVLQRFRSQHSLGNVPVIFVHGAIVATNAVLIIAQRRSVAGQVPLTLKDSCFPILDAALSEMTVSWELAGQARLRFRSALAHRQQQLQDQLDQQLHQQLHGQLTAENTTHARIQLRAEDEVRFDFQRQQGTNPMSAENHGNKFTVEQSHAATEENPTGDDQLQMDLYNWDDSLALAAIDRDGVLCADLNTDFFAGWDAEFNQQDPDRDIWGGDGRQPFDF